MRPTGDHFYTTSAQEHENAVATLGYLNENISSWVFNQQQPMMGVSLYRLFNDVDHFYTTSAPEADQAVLTSGYQMEGVACNVLPIGDPNGTPLFRMYYPQSGDHFYTTSAPERDNAVQNIGYQDEGVACFVPAATAPQAIPFYRAYHPQMGNHFYTTSEPEKNNAVQNLGYQDEGIACHVFAAVPLPTLPVYRSFRPSTGDHFYTTDLNEHGNAVNNLQYQDEGIACYVPPGNQNGAVPFFRSLAGSGDHFYTTSLAEHQNAVNALGFQDEGQAFFVFDNPNAVPGIVPLFRSFKRYGAMVRLHIKVVQAYVNEGVAGLVLLPNSALGIPLFRSFNPNTGDHFYTTSAAEHASAIANSGYQSEGIACNVPMQAGNDTTPLFRSFQPNGGDHFYTTSMIEHTNAVQQLGYTDEGTACLVFAVQLPGRIPLHRMFNAETGDHFYTISTAERDSAVQNNGHQIALSTMLTTMQRIYDQADIFVKLGSTEFISRESMVDTDVGQCNGPTTGEQNDLFQLRDFANQNDVVVYIVRMTNPPFNGCASHPANLPGAIVVRTSTVFTLAHEVGHVLGLAHVDDNTRIMTGNGTGNIMVATPSLISSEISTMDNSPFTFDI